MKGEARAQGGAVFHGWWIVLTAATGLSLGFVPIIGFTFSVFFHQLSQEFGWSRSEISLGFSLALQDGQLPVPDGPGLELWIDEPVWN